MKHSFLLTFFEKRTTIIKYAILLFIVFNSLFTLGQSSDNKSPFQFILYNNIFNPYSPNHLDSNVTFTILNDSNNIWQIGSPNKPPLDTTPYPPNALLTDTVFSYPVNNHSVFELHARKPLCCPFLCWSRMILQIAFISDVDSLKDGLYIEVSYNDSGVWTNVFNDTFADEKISSLFNNFPNDTLFNGEWGISHLYQNIPSWFSYFDVTWQWLTQNNTQYLVDSVAFRFHFVSDSINTNKQGIEILYVYLGVSDLCSASVENNIINDVTIFPNPVNDLSVIRLDKDNNYRLEVYNITGQVVLTTDFFGSEYRIGQNKFLSGYYYFIVTSPEHREIKGSFVVN